MNRTISRISRSPHRRSEPQTSKEAPFITMEPMTDIATYLTAQELGDRILESYPPLHSIDDPTSPVT